MTLYLIFLLTLLLLLSGIFSASETAIFYLSKENIEILHKKNQKKATIIEELIKNPQKLLITILICNLLVNISASLVTETLLNNRILATIVATILIIIFGEAGPKTIAVKESQKISILFSPIIFFLSRLLKPLINIFQLISNFLIKIYSFFYKYEEEKNTYNPEELLPLMEEAENKKVITKDELHILENIINFEKLELIHVLTPRTEIFSLSSEEILYDVIDLIKEKKFSKIPIWEQKEDNIIAVLYVKDLLYTSIEKKKKIKAYKNLLKKPLYVPDFISPQQLLSKFQQTNNQIAFVINEYGDLIGLITLEDIIEKIIGEIKDKEDAKPFYYLYDPNVIEVEARIELSKFNEIFKTKLQDNNAATLAGYLLNKIRHIPKAGEVFIFDNLKFTITEATLNKIEKITVTKIKRRIKNK